MWFNFIFDAYLIVTELKVIVRLLPLEVVRHAARYLVAPRQLAARPPPLAVHQAQSLPCHALEERQLRIAHKNRTVFFFGGGLKIFPALPPALDDDVAVGAIASDRRRHVLYAVRPVVVQVGLLRRRVQLAEVVLLFRRQQQMEETKQEQRSACGETHIFLQRGSAL